MCTSAAAFEEVLSFSKWKECDFLLLGGDVFHDNKVNKRHFCLLFCMSFVLKFLNY
jgi:DNA repair exonuclease SbcCD nuclease subunit